MQKRTRNTRKSRYSDAVSAIRALDYGNDEARYASPTPQGGGEPAADQFRCLCSRPCSLKILLHEEERPRRANKEVAVARWIAHLKKVRREYWPVAGALRSQRKRVASQTPGSSGGRHSRLMITVL